MVAKILSKTGTFNAVRYNSNKQSKGSAELIEIKNFKVLNPETMTAADVKNYLKAYSDMNKRVKNPQFHATISCKGREYSPNQLKEIGNQYMDKMGYGKQPYIIVLHSDTNNNHIHIVSTRVDSEGKKINDSYENVRSLNAVQEIMKESISHSNVIDLDALKSYQLENKNQFISLLKLHKFEVRENDNILSIYKLGVKCEDLDIDSIKFHSPNNVAISKIKEIFSNLSGSDKTISPVFNSNNEILNYKSDFTDELKKRNIDVVFHFSKMKKPFGFTVIDNNNKVVFKGSSIAKLNNVFTSVKPVPENDVNRNKVYSERLIASKYNVSSQIEREMLSKYLGIDIQNVQLNDKSVAKEDLLKFKVLFADCKSVDDLERIKRINTIELYNYKNNVFLITDKKQIINLNDLLEDKKLLFDYQLMNKQEETKSTGKMKASNDDLDLDNNKSISDYESEEPEIDKSIDVDVEVVKGIISAIGGQGSAEPEKKRKKRKL